MHDPELLLLDEPTVGVDPQSRNSIFDSITELHRQGRTIIYTTHYMGSSECTTSTDVALTARSIAATRRPESAVKSCSTVTVSDSST